MSAVAFRSFLSAGMSTLSSGLTRFMRCARGDASGSLAAARFSKKSLSERPWQSSKVSRAVACSS
eukprot:368335-Pyramimonas_sp.AAC.1